MTASGAAPGWYADAAEPALIRWWDGVAWTDHTQPNPATAAQPAAMPDDAPTAPALPAPVPAAPPLSSAPYVPPPFADPPPPPPAAALDFPPPTLAAPELASPTAPGPRRAGGSMPISEPVRLVPPTSGSIPVAGFPGFDDPLPKANPGPEPLAVPTPLATPLATPTPLAVPGVLAAATPLPASASTPWTATSTFAQPTGSIDLASVDYEPMTRSWGSARPTSVPRAVTGVTTGGAWMLALSPLLQLGLAALGWWLTDGGASSITTYVAAGLGTAALLWVVVAVILDYRRLGALGHEFRPSVGWVVVGPFFYLMARAIHVYRTTRSGTGPTWVYVVSALLVGATLSLASLALPREASLAELRAVETQITADLRTQGIDYSVMCPSQASGSLGSSFVCTAYDEVGPAALLRVTWTGVAGDFSYEFESSPA